MISWCPLHLRETEAWRLQGLAEPCSRAARPVASL